MSYNNLVKFLELKSAADPTLIGLQNTKLKEFTSWIFEKTSEGLTRLGDSRNLKILSAVVENEKALSAFRAGKSLSEAAILTEAPATAFRIAINDARSNLETARDTIHFVDKPSGSDAEILLEIQKIARDLRELVKNRLYKKEETDF